MYRCLRTLSLSLLSVATIECTAAAAAQVAIEPSDATGSRFKIVISGPINVATLVDFSRALVDPRIAKTRAPSVELDSPGGSIPAAMAIGGFVRSGGLRTAVAWRRTCDSACALILVAGIERSAGLGSVSIHRPRYEAGRAGEDAIPRVRERYNEVLASMRDYLKHMGPGEELLEAMLAVPSGRLRPLSQHELRAFGLSPSRTARTKSLARHAAAGPARQTAGTGKLLAAHERLRQAIAAGPPPGLWRVSARGSQLRPVPGKVAHSHHPRTHNARHSGRAPPFA
jgi:hypothetical protein